MWATAADKEQHAFCSREWWEEIKKRQVAGVNMQNILIIQQKYPIISLYVCVRVCARERERQRERARERACNSGQPVK